MRLEVRVFGVPAPQGSKKFVGKGRFIESSKKVAPWRKAVEETIREKTGGELWFPKPMAVITTATFYLPRPKSIPKKTLWPVKYPDIDKLIRSTSDAFTMSGVLEDDSQIIGWYAVKHYEEEHMKPGAILRVREWPGDV